MCKVLCVVLLIHINDISCQCIYMLNDLRYWNIGVGNWEQTSDGYIKVAPGIQGADLYLKAPESLNWKEYSYSVNMAILRNQLQVDYGSVGILFNIQNITKKMFTGIHQTSGQLVLFQNIEGNWDFIERFNKSIDISKEIMFKVKVNGNNYVIYLNNELVTSRTSSNFNGGSIGLFSWISGAIYSSIMVNVSDPCTTKTPTKYPSNIPTNMPSKHPSISPTIPPTINPSQSPTITPSNTPSQSPTNIPTNNPSHSPTYLPSKTPSNIPSFTPTNIPTTLPSNTPSNIPSLSPTYSPSIEPTISPTNNIDSATNSQPKMPSQMEMIFIIVSVIVGIFVILCFGLIWFIIKGCHSIKKDIDDIVYIQLKDNDDEQAIPQSPSMFDGIYSNNKSMTPGSPYESETPRGPKSFRYDSINNNDNNFRVTPGNIGNNYETPNGLMDDINTGSQGIELVSTTQGYNIDSSSSDENEMYDPPSTFNTPGNVST